MLSDPRLIFLLVLLMVWSVNAFSWTTTRPATEGEAPRYIQSVEVDVFGPEEIAMIVRDADTLDAYARKPDCFRRAAGTIRTRCGELDINEDERVRAAISMTLCELATAKRYSTPLECEPFLSGSAVSEREMLGAQSACVEALSRSTQHWSSYSGYLREVPQLCYAFRRWNDIDTAREIYQNATNEKLALLKLLVAREKRLQQSQQSSDRVIEDMSNVLTKMHSSTSDIETVSERLEHRIQDSLETTIQVLANAISNVHLHNEEYQLRSLTKVDTAIELLVDRHSKTLETVIPVFQRSLLFELERAFSLNQERHQGIFDVVEATHAHLLSIGGEFETLQEEFARLTGIASQTKIQLNAHVLASDQALARQLEASASALQLTDALSGLASIAHREIAWINETAAAVRHTLTSNARDGFGPDWAAQARNVAFWIAEYIFRADPAYMDWIIRLPICRALDVCFWLVWYVLHASMSSVMSVVFLVLSARRWMTGPSRTNCNSNAWDPDKSSLAHPSWYSDHSLGESPPDNAGNTLHSPRRRPRLSRIPDRLCRPSSEKLL